MDNVAKHVFWNKNAFNSGSTQFSIISKSTYSPVHFKLTHNFQICFWKKNCIVKRNNNDWLCIYWWNLSSRREWVALSIRDAIFHLSTARKKWFMCRASLYSYSWTYVTWVSLLNRNMNEKIHVLGWGHQTWNLCSKGNKTPHETLGDYWFSWINFQIMNSVNTQWLLRYNKLIFSLYSTQCMYCP